VAIALLLALADLYGTFEHGPAAFVKYVAVWALFELGVRRPWSLSAVGAGVLAIVYTLHTWSDLPAELPALLYRIAVPGSHPV
jgi:hypothetical protein